MPTFDSILVTGNGLVQQDFQVNGNTTILQDFQVNQDQTVAGNLQVNNNETVAGHLQVNGSTSIINHLGVNGEANVGGSLTAGQRLNVINQPTVPIGVPQNPAIRFYSSGNATQPGLLLKGTDGLNYVLFVDVSGGTPTLAIQRVI